MEPVRVKLYGLMSMTRRGYLTQLSVAVVIALGLLAFWWLRWPAMSAPLKRTPSPELERVIRFWDHLPWFVGAVLLLLLIEACIVLRLFARKEAERRKQQPSHPVETPSGEDAG